MSGYDAWLEKPYTDAAREDAEYERWLEKEEVEDTPEAWEQFQQWISDIEDEEPVLEDDD